MRQATVLLLTLAGLTAGRRMMHVLSDLGRQRWPEFVCDPGAQVGIPVFTYHSIAPPEVPDSITPGAFERHMHYLAENGYCALTADELVDCLKGNRTPPPRAVAITFDDGRASVWTTAYPILKRYGMRAICFLVPSFMAETGLRPTLEDNAVVPDTLLYADVSDMPALTWDEVAVMHTDGLIDFQSHTQDHTLIFCAPDIVDYYHPGFNTGFHHVHLPVIRWGTEDHLHKRPPWGTPIYRSQPRLGAARRYFDDEGLRSACIEIVAQQGAEAFFAQPRWRDRLSDRTAAYQRNHPSSARYETEDEQRRAIINSLAQSKNAIEARLPHHIVRHLCYPWHHASSAAACLARDTGYVSAFVAINPQKSLPDCNNPYLVQRFIPTNQPGDDPFQITRLDARGDLPLSLPGRERLTFFRRVSNRLLRPPALLSTAHGQRPAGGNL